MSVPLQPSPRRLLIRSVNWLGDAVMTTPALLRLREKFPDAHIALLAPEKLADLWKHHPAIDEVIPFAAKDNVFAIGKKLRARKFDHALVLPNSPRSALEVFLARIPQRIGYARPWRNFFLRQIVPARAEAVKMHKRSVPEIQRLVRQNPESRIQNPTIPQAAHQTYEYLHLAGALGANPEPLPPQLFVTPEEITAAKEKFGLNKISAPIFGLNPGAEYGPAKRWPVEKFIAAAQEIQQRTGCIWILFGGKGDSELTARIASEIQPTANGHQPLNLAGKTTLRELMALLKICRVLLTNDTGPAHVAAAMETPVVIPFGSTSPELTAPGLPGDPRNHFIKSDAPCSPCFLRECPIDFRCMNGLGLGQIVNSVLTLLNQ